MLTVSIVWVLLAAAVIVIASVRRSGAARNNTLQARDSGRTLVLLAALYSLALLAGFVYVSRFLVSSL